MSDQPFDSVSDAAIVRPTSEFLQGSSRLIWRRDDPVFLESDLPPGGYDQIVTSDAPLRIRIWWTDAGTVRFRIGRWGEMPDAKLREP